MQLAASIGTDSLGAPLIGWALEEHEDVLAIRESGIVLAPATRTDVSYPGRQPDGAPAPSTGPPPGYAACTACHSPETAWWTAFGLGRRLHRDVDDTDVLGALAAQASVALANARLYAEQAAAAAVNARLHEEALELGRLKSSCSRTSATRSAPR